MPRKQSKSTAADLIRRLPIHQQLYSAQMTLVKLSPIWARWVDLKLSKEFAETTRLTAIQNSVLSIACDNSSCASQIKHQQENLLGYLREHGFEQIKKVRITISQPLDNSAIDKSASNAYQRAKQESLQHQAIQTSPQSLKAINSCQKSVKNEELAKSLAKLATTLRDLN